MPRASSPTGPDRSRLQPARRWQEIYVRWPASAPLAGFRPDWREPGVLKRIALARMGERDYSRLRFLPQASPGIVLRIRAVSKSPSGFPPNLGAPPKDSRPKTRWITQVTSPRIGTGLESWSGEAILSERSKLFILAISCLVFAQACASILIPQGFALNVFSDVTQCILLLAAVAALMPNTVRTQG